MKQAAILCEAVAEGNMVLVKQLIEKDKLNPKFGDYD